MKTLTKILLTLSISLFFIGVVMCGLAYVVGGTDLSKMDFETEYEELEYTSQYTTTKDISIDADRHNIVIRESLSAANVSIKYSENQYDKFFMTDDGNTITLTNKDSKNAFIRFFCLLFDSKNKSDRIITVTLPARYAGSISIKADKADIDASNIKNLYSLNIDLGNGDVLLDTLNCSSAVLVVKTGEITVNDGTYTSLDITVANPVQYLPIDEVDPELWPSDIIVPATPTITPSQTLSPIGTPSTNDTEAHDNEDDPKETPSATPTPTVTPSATKVPTILVVEASVKLDKVDVQDLTINATYTNIEGSLARGDGYYNITTDNETSSNIATNNNTSAVGSITINQKEGKTEIEFK